MTDDKIMKAYNYLLFRVYRLYIDGLKKNNSPLFNTACVSSLFVYFNLYTIYAYLVYKDILKELIPNKYYVIIPMIVVWLLNYFLFIRGKRFLDYNFRKDARGGILIFVYIVISAGSFITVANYNRAKIFKIESMQPVRKNLPPTRPSLEGEVREWIHKNF